jgi:hypothetical protein
MATLSVRTIAASCLGRQSPVSLRRHVFGIYGNNAQSRSLRARLHLAQTKPFIRVALVTVRPIGSTQGAYVNLQRDLDSANEVWQQECGAWIYCVDSIVAVTGAFGANGILDQNACPLGIQDDPTAEEDALFDLGRGHGADVVCYFIAGSSNPALAGCAAYPEGRRGFWVMFGSSQWMFAHELTHVIGLNPHPNRDPEVPDDDQDNLMWPTPGAITNPPPDLRDVQCGRINDDDGLESC